MSTIAVVLETSPDGTLHLPLPDGWRKGFVKVEANLEWIEPLADAQTQTTQSAQPPSRAPRLGCIKGFWTSPDFDDPLEDFGDYRP